MGYKNDKKHFSYALDNIELANNQFAKNKQMIEKASSMLPSNRDLINKINQFGLSRI